ncbi:VTT domain-containing protein [Corynebacterium uropygiale]|uniref:VTT domain-containing protein n=1 Tax=Corynebacterium uropygiale TaxID=1775911 RepID=A0A9X1U815_9CORY|nr:VTT domain-containing protein [Corynebacterium uropygiale]MCF4007327.1 VTT domain-containing protein [Corynebacterium uropygiale]
MTSPADGTTPDNVDNIPSYLRNPGKRDYLILAYILVGLVLSMAFIPLRAWFLNHAEIYALLVGGYTSAVVGGAQSTAGGTPAWAIVAMTLVGSLYLMPQWWLIGRYWGREYLEQMSSQSPSMGRWTRRLENLSTPALMGATVLSYIPFLPTLIICNLLSGIRKIPLWAVLLINAVGTLLRNSIFAYLGVRYGQEVLQVVSVVNRYALWVTLALVVIMIISIRQKARQAPSARR